MPAATLPTLTRGHKKKARTRRLLLDAALALLIEQGDTFAVSDVTARAAVSHGTFYNYFPDRDGLLDALMPHVVEDFAARMAVEVDDLDPATRFARITARALEAAIDAPATMRMVSRLDALQRVLLVDGPLAHLRQDLADGHAMGRFTDPPDDGTVDVLLGALLLAARRIVEGETAADYRRTVIRRLLQALGVEAVEAGRLAHAAVTDRR